jgi:hypothetical protein
MAGDFLNQTGKVSASYRKGKLRMQIFKGEYLQAIGKAD